MKPREPPRRQKPNQNQPAKLCKRSQRRRRARCNHRKHPQNNQQTQTCAHKRCNPHAASQQKPPQPRRQEPSLRVGLCILHSSNHPTPPSSPRHIPTFRTRRNLRKTRPVIPAPHAQAMCPPPIKLAPLPRRKKYQRGNAPTHQRHQHHQRTKNRNRPRTRRRIRHHRLHAPNNKHNHERRHAHYQHINPNTPQAATPRKCLPTAPAIVLGFLLLCHHSTPLA